MCHFKFVVVGLMTFSDQAQFAKHFFFLLECDLDTDLFINRIYIHFLIIAASELLVAHE